MPPEEAGPFALASAVIRTLPERLPSVRAVLVGLPGLGIHGETPQGALVITLEGQAPDPLAETLHRIRDIPGVLTAELIYQHYEEDPDSHGKETQQ